MRLIPIRGMCLVAVLATLSISVDRLVGQLALPPIRDLPPAAAEITIAALGSDAPVILSDGRLIVHRTRDSQIVVLDTSFALEKRVPLPPNPGRFGYSVFGGALFPFRGDSAIFQRYNADAHLIIGPSGEIAREILKTTGRPEEWPSGDGNSRVSTGDVVVEWLPHSTVCTPRPVRDIWRYSVERRTTDTVARIRAVEAPCFLSRRDAAGNVLQIPLIHPLLRVDSWTTLPDGTIVVVRASDYHLDFLRPDGSVRSTPPIAHQWQTLTSVEKKPFLDSLRVYFLANPPRAPGSMLGVTTMEMRSVRFEIANLEAMPDTVPAHGDEVFLDRQGRLWIENFRESFRPLPGGNATQATFDVVDLQGRLVDRVRLPGGAMIMGFSEDALFAVQGGRGSAQKLLRIPLQ